MMAQRAQDHGPMNVLPGEAGPPGSAPTGLSPMSLLGPGSESASTLTPPMGAGAPVGSWNMPAPQDAMGPSVNTSVEGSPVMVFNPSQGGWHQEAVDQPPVADADTRTAPGDEPAEPAGPEAPAAGATTNAVKSE